MVIRWPLGTKSKAKWALMLNLINRHLIVTWFNGTTFKSRAF